LRRDRYLIIIAIQVFQHKFFIFAKIRWISILQNRNNMSVTFKIIFSEDNIRRLKFEVLPSFEDFISLLKNTYPSYFCEDKKFVLKYLDCDNDKIAVSSQIEFEELISQLSGESILRVYVESNEQPKVQQEQEQPILPEEQAELNNFLGKIEEAFKEIPHVTENLMGQCDNAFQSIRNHQTFYQLHRLSLQYLESFDKNIIQKGRDLIVQMLEMNPPNPAIALYNLACAESLLGNIKEAIAALEKSIKAGYHDLTHILNDKDFDNIKNSEGFLQLIAQLRNTFEPKPKEEVKVEEKKRKS